MKAVVKGVSLNKLRNRAALIRSIGLVRAFNSLRLRPIFEELPEVVQLSTRRTKIAIIVHVHYLDQVASIAETLSDIQYVGDLFITCSNPEADKYIRSELSRRRISAEVRQCPNRGRNFGPLLVEYGQALSDYETLIHFHTKRTNHAKLGYGAEWSSELIAPISMPVLKRTLDIFEENPDVGLVFGDVTHRIRAINYYWGSNAKPLNDLLDLMVKDENLPLLYPAGGMFAVRIQALTPILERKWSYADFPLENNQIDGTIQHGLERYVGHLVTQSRLKQVVYKSSKNAFCIWEGWSGK